MIQVKGEAHFLTVKINIVAFGNLPIEKYCLSIKMIGRRKISLMKKTRLHYNLLKLVKHRGLINNIEIGFLKYTFFYSSE